ncbi:MAG TPA: DHH family phosphoesterase [Longimicrobiales bacterium]|nr:DHH family phosphoesterase [Longimicrobiales bacterium]
MPAEQIEAERVRPLLIVISDSPDLPARIRSHDREVRRWSPGPVDDAGAGVRAFTGDPTDADTWAWTRDAHGVTAVIDLADSGRVRGALGALRTVRPDAAVLILSDQVRDLDHAGDGTLARGGDIRDVLRLDIDDELQRLEAERRTWCLRTFAGETDVVPIMVHADPDPDALSSALGVRMLLGRNAESMPIVTVDPMTRRENRRMADLLNIRVTRITMDELRRFDRVIVVDTQPRDVQEDGQPRVAVIDHHPPEHGTWQADFADIRPAYGATATMLTEYLRALDEKRISGRLATALLYGIRSDTKALSRGVSPADVEAYAFLQRLADLQLVRRFERPSYSAESARRFGRALADVECRDELCVSWLGQLEPDESHMLPDFADFCLGIENVTWVAAAALLEGSFVITLRHAGSSNGIGAGDVARALAGEGGNGGGHAEMARVRLEPEAATAVLGAEPGEGTPAALIELMRSVLGDLAGDASRPASRPARRASDPAAANP